MPKRCSPSARQRSASLRAKYDLQQSAIRQASADLDAKSAQADFAKVDAERYRTLALSNYGSRQNAERTSALDQQARAAVASAQAALAAAKQQLSVLDADITGATAAVAQARADLETARLNLSYAEIRAPIDGYIGNRAAQVGAYVAQGAHLLTIIPAHGLWVDANFKEDQLARMKPGQPATIVADTLPDHVFHGRLLSLAPATGAVFSVIPPENATGNFTKIVQRVPVRIALDEDDAATSDDPARPFDDRDHRYAAAIRGLEMSEERPREFYQKHRPIHRDVLRRLHGAVGHPDRGVLAAKYRRRAVGGAGRDQLGSDRVPHSRNYRHSTCRAG